MLQNSRSSLNNPFGQADCESEIKQLKDDYSKIYFSESPFNEAAIDPCTYLLIGRRGSGKTALSQYFSFQNEIPNPVAIDVDEPAVYQQVLAQVATLAASDLGGLTLASSREVGIPRLRKIWEYVIWCVIFAHTRHLAPEIEEACVKECDHSKVSRLIGSVIEKLLCLFKEKGDEESEVDKTLDNLLSEERLALGRQAVLRLAAKRPIIIAVDTLEKHDRENEPLMNSMAALVQHAANFNVEYADQHIHLKVFVSGEIFPYLEEEVIQNPLKSIKGPVYLIWRPKDLLRLICWRYYSFLHARDTLLPISRGNINWENYQEVMDKMWKPYFGEYLTNSRGHREHSFAYILRHTQMRPRQLILICNAIAQISIKSGMFPVLSESAIRTGVKRTEGRLAKEIINSFSLVYSSVGTIVDSLMKMPIMFEGNELDKRASQSASEWGGSYSPAKFRRLVAELGIVGRVRRYNKSAGYIDADFEYALSDRLPLTHRDTCVLHPMFYSRLNVDFNTPARVMPFSTEREIREADNDFDWDK